MNRTVPRRSFLADVGHPVRTGVEVHPAVHSLPRNLREEKPRRRGGNAEPEEKEGVAWRARESAGEVFNQFEMFVYVAGEGGEHRRVPLRAIGAEKIFHKDWGSTR